MRMPSNHVTFMDESATDLFNLEPVERAQRYRKLAEAMRCFAASAESEDTRRGYLRMAIDWLDMADKLNAEFGNVSVTVDAPEMAALLERSNS
jgi:hypothetical protein